MTNLQVNKIKTFSQMKTTNKHIYNDGTSVIYERIIILRLLAITPPGIKKLNFL